MNEAMFGFLGVLIGSLIPWIKESLDKRGQKSRESKYLAVQVVCVLDEFVQKCAEVVGDDGTSMSEPAGRTSSGEMYYEVQVATPKEIVFPNDVNWQSIDSDIMYRILMLPNNIRSSNRAIINASEHSYPPDYGPLFETRWEEFSNLGLEAVSLCGELRKRYKLPKLNTNALYPKEIFVKKLEEIEKDRKAWSADLFDLDDPKERASEA